MRFVGLPENIVDIEFLAEPSVQFADAKFDVVTQLCESLDTLQNLAAELLLCGFWKSGHLADRDF